MATKREIQDLLKNIDVTIDENDIEDTMEYGHVLKREKTIKEALLKNAEYIDFKKLLIIIVKRRKELVDEYKTKKISPLLGEVNEKELEKTINFAKLYIKPEEKIIVSSLSDSMVNEKKEYKILDSREVIYGQKVEIKNELYDKIKDSLPDIKPMMYPGLLKCAFDEPQIIDKQFAMKVIEFLKNEGVSDEEVSQFFLKMQNSKTAEDIESLNNSIDEKRFNLHMKKYMDTIKPYINVEKCILFYGFYINSNLEERRRNR